MPDATTPNLLPCPFCGSADTDDVLYCAVDEYHRAYVTCSNCFAEGPVVSDEEIGSAAAIEQAAAAWNQRSAWQPIETAPRGGKGSIEAPTEILVWDGYEMRVELPQVGYHPRVTHWRPLPSPPITPNPHA